MLCIHFQILQSLILLIILKCSDSERRFLLQSPEHRQILSDKDYASSVRSPSSSVAARVAPPVARRSPQFDEDDDTIKKLKLAPNEEDSKTRVDAKCATKDALMLPKSFIDLEVIFEHVLNFLAVAHAKAGRPKPIPLEALKSDMMRVYPRSFRNEHLQQIIALVPNCLIVGHAWKDGKCHRTVSINSSNINLGCETKLHSDEKRVFIIHEKCLMDMKSSLRQSMLSFVRARHVEYLQTNHPELKLDPERIFQFHANFDFSALLLPTADLPLLPQVEVSSSTHSIVKDTAVKITPEIEQAFKNHEAETMTLAKRNHIKACSKSAIGLQNIEKVQKFELIQFAQQQSDKIANEKNAETIFRTSANSLRALFRQRGKTALPQADVLKILQQTKGLTFKNSLDTMDMLKQLVEKLPNFFSLKKFPTHGDMVMFLSSDVLPWQHVREYPQ